jgi:hypothetical protein
MRARIARLATPRRVVAIECSVAALVTALGVVVLRASPWAFALLAVCGLTMAPALAIVGRIERGGRGD